MRNQLGSCLLPYVALCGLAAPVAIGQTQGRDRLYSVSPTDNVLRQVDPLTARTLSSVPMTIPGGTVNQANGIATHPTTGELWVLIQIQGTRGRSLAKVNPATGIATVIGNTGDAFAGLDFDAMGTLYGVTGDGATTPETLFTLDQNTGQPTLFLRLGNGTDGETVAFHPPSALMYHASGTGTQNTNEILETIDLTRMTVTNVPLSGTDYEEAIAMTWWVGDNFLVADLNDDLFVVSTAGVVSMIGTLDHTSKGFAFLPTTNVPFFAPYGNGCPANGGYIPVLAGSGRPAPATTFTTGIVNGPGGAPGVLLFGLGRNTLPITPTCVIQNIPILPLVVAVTLQGTGSGQGKWSLQLPVPAGTLPGDINFQVVLFESVSAIIVTNPLQVHVQ